MSSNHADNAIEVRNLSKVYRIAHDGMRRPTFRDVVMDRLRNPFKRTAYEDFWALNDVSFDVPRGEVMGVIGRNGAGKSTLLKILSRVTEPTKGAIDLYGRVGSLLEVGTGFHPELTGRENIYLNGSMLGMRRKEIARHFDAIVAFAEVEKFLDTPVKRYSSGMYVRLAFAVAAHLDPEILIVDEVLAVGDAEFQKRCLGKMSEVAHSGRTVLFVSHNMNAVEELCDRVMILRNGQVQLIESNVRAGVTSYLFGAEADESQGTWRRDANSRYGDGYFRPTRFYLGDAHGHALSMPVRNDTDMWVWIEAEVDELDPATNAGYALYNNNGELLFWTATTDGPEEQWPRLQRGKNRLGARLPARLLNEDEYRFDLIASLHNRKFICEPGVSAPSFFITIQGGLSDSPYWMSRRPGLFAPEFEWTQVAQMSPEYATA